MGEENRRGVVKIEEIASKLQTKEEGKLVITRSATFNYTQSSIFNLR